MAELSETHIRARPTVRLQCAIRRTSPWRSRASYAESTVGAGQRPGAGTHPFIRRDTASIDNAPMPDRSLIDVRFCSIVSGNVPSTRVAPKKVSLPPEGTLVDRRLRVAVPRAEAPVDCHRWRAVLTVDVSRGSSQSRTRESRKICPSPPKRKGNDPGKRKADGGARAFRTARAKVSGRASDAGSRKVQLAAPLRGIMGLFRD